MDVVSSQCGLGPVWCGRRAPVDRLPVSLAAFASVARLGLPAVQTGPDHTLLIAVIGDLRIGARAEGGDGVPGGSARKGEVVRIAEGARRGRPLGGNEGGPRGREGGGG